MKGDRKRRQGSRLECDDPDHCLWCGAEIGDVRAELPEGDDVRFCPQCAINEMRLKAEAAEVAEETHGEQIHPKQIDEPPEDWDLSRELWYNWSAEGAAQYKAEVEG